MYIRKYTYLDGAITAPKAPKLSVYRVASRGVAKKRANRNKSLDISEATRRGTRRAARGDRNGEGEGEQAQRDVRTFLIYERAYFLGLLHMDISSGTERCEPRRMRESAEQRPRGTLMLVPSSFRLAAQFFLSFSLFLSLSLLSSENCSCQPRTTPWYVLWCTMITRGKLKDQEETKRRFEEDWWTTNTKILETRRTIENTSKLKVLRKD